MKQRLRNLIPLKRSNKVSSVFRDIYKGCYEEELVMTNLEKATYINILKLARDSKFISEEIYKGYYEKKATQTIT